MRSMVLVVAFGSAAAATVEPAMAQPSVDVESWAGQFTEDASKPDADVIAADAMRMAAPGFSANPVDVLFRPRARWQPTQSRIDGSVDEILDAPWPT